MKLSRFSFFFSLVGVLFNGSVWAADFGVPATSHLLKKDPSTLVAKLAKIVSKPLPKGSSHPTPSSDPTDVGASLLFFAPEVAADWSSVPLPAGNWVGLGKPAGSTGYKYRGTGHAGDPCKSVIIKRKIIRAICKGSGSFDASSSPFPVGVGGVGWQLIIGGDRYCALSSVSTEADVKRNDSTVYKSVKAAAPGACPDPALPTPTPTPTPTPSPTATPSPMPTPQPGVKFNDVNGDGSWEPATESGMPGWTIYVDYDDDGVLDAGEPFAITGASGAYMIEGVAPGTWRLREISQPGWICTTPATSDEFGCYYEGTFEDGMAAALFGNFHQE